jgi:hypothetical protein
MEKNSMFVDSYGFAYFFSFLFIFHDLHTKFIAVLHTLIASRVLAMGQWFRLLVLFFNPRPVQLGQLKHLGDKEKWNHESGFANPALLAQLANNASILLSVK